jgi:O-methyltransferase
VWPRDPLRADDLGGGMSTVHADDAVNRYLVASCTPPDPVLSSLIQHTERVGELSGMMVPVEQALFLTILTRCLNARSVLDVGTFTGMSALSFARGLAPGGRVITCDVSLEWLPIAREHWTMAGVADRIDFRAGPAAKTMAALRDVAPLDIVFVDADKMGYPRYYELAVPLLRPGGLLILDNTLWYGSVLDPPAAPDEITQMIAETLHGVNAAVARDERLDAVLLPIADGVTIARRR